MAIFETLFTTLCFLNLSGIAGFYIRVNTVARTDEPVEVWPESEAEPERPLPLRRLYPIHVAHARRLGQRHHGVT